MKLFATFISLVLLFEACEHKNAKATTLSTVNQIWLDSIIKNSDTSFVKPYKRPDFVTAAFYISRKDSSEAQVMRDSAQQVRQIIISRNHNRVYFAQYYLNGQLMADLKLDSTGQYTGPATYYFENGNIRRQGNYINGFSRGQWEEFNENGDMTLLSYDSNGTRIN